MADKQIFELPDITLDILNSGLDIGFVAQVESYGLDFKVPADLLIQYFNQHPSQDIYSGSTNPSGATGQNGDIYFQTNGKIYLKKNGVWTLKAVLPISGSAVLQQAFTVTAGVTTWPLPILISSYPGFDQNSEFIYKVDGTGKKSRQNDLTVDELVPGGTFTGFNVYGDDDGTGHAAYSGSIVMVSASTGTPTGADLLTTANDWQQPQTFDYPPLLKNAGHLLSLIAVLSADRSWTFPDKTDTVAGLLDVPIVKPLSGTSDGVNPIVTIAHGITLYAPTACNVQPNDANSAASFCWSEIVGSTVKIHYTGFVPPAGAVHYTGAFK